MPYGLDPALRAWTQNQTGQLPYYLGGLGALGQNWGGALPSGPNLPWAH